MTEKLKIRECGYYRNGYGEVRGPIMPSGDDEYQWGDRYDTYRHDGTWNFVETERDLISEVYVSDTPPAEWQPMETAPKDGKHSIFAIKFGAFVYSIQGCWDNQKQAFINAADRDGEYLAWMPNVRLPDEFCPWTDAYKARKGSEPEGGEA